MLTNNSNRQAGFTLIELVVVVMIIGVLSSIAISSYQTYTVRAQVSEGLTLASNIKAPVVDAYLTTGEAPTNRSEASLSPGDTDSKGEYVKSISVVNGRIDIIFGNDANVLIADASLSLTPYETPDGSVVWRCGDEAQPTNTTATPLATMGSGGGGSSATFRNTSVEPRYLPPSCR